jgi:glycosyltransferase involved in cell wall biosynthesis
MKVKQEDIYNYNRWPWSETSVSFPEFYKESHEWPKLSIIIPSFNQGDFIEETIRSVVYQNYPNLELIIIDGGSKDNTVEIIKKYTSHISYWVSEPDNGQSHAINKGFVKATGQWVAWINSDDCYLRNAFYYLFVEINLEPYNFIYGNYLSGGSLSNNREIKVKESFKMSLSTVIRFFFGIDYIIPSQSVFVKKEMIDLVGLLNEDLHYCMDVEWYARIFMLKPNIFKYNKTICFFRYNETTKTGSLGSKISSENKMGIEAEQIALEYSKRLNFIEKFNFKNLFHYYLMYSKEPGKYENCSFGYLLKIFFRHPIQSLSDRRILGLFKRKLFLQYKYNN